MTGRRRLGGRFWGLDVARLTNGFDLVAEATQLERWIRWADLILTGEGSLDEQSFSGKAVGRLIQQASLCGVPTLAIVPRLDFAESLCPALVRTKGRSSR